MKKALPPTFYVALGGGFAMMFLLDVVLAPALSAETSARSPAEDLGQIAHTTEDRTPADGSAEERSAHTPSAPAMGVSPQAGTVRTDTDRGNTELNDTDRGDTALNDTNRGDAALNDTNRDDTERNDTTARNSAGGDETPSNAPADRNAERNHAAPDNAVDRSGTADRTAKRNAEANRQAQDGLPSETKTAGAPTKPTEPLPSLLFRVGSARLQGDQREVLDRIAKLLAQRPDARVLLLGHTDQVGSFEANQVLSRTRAQAVAAALARRGIPIKQFIIRGLGESEPTGSGEPSQDRRVELFWH